LSGLRSLSTPEPISSTTFGKQSAHFLEGRFGPVIADSSG
jgi:hypothetical protein